MEYRTDEQFLEIIEGAISDNWEQAGADCVEYGFWADDLIKKYKEHFDEPNAYFDEIDLAIIVEIAMKFRNKDQRH